MNLFLPTSSMSLSGDNVALVTGSSFSIVKPLLVRLRADNEHVITFSHGAFHELGTARTQRKVPPVDDRVDAMFSQPHSEREHPRLVSFAVP